eukprot:4500778-Prymnesium_polylepis.2
MRRPFYSVPPRAQAPIATLHVTRADGRVLAARFVIKLFDGALCGLGGTDLTFSACDQQERSLILQKLRTFEL